MKLYIRTFGCQMNEYDSAKMADVLAAAEAFRNHGRSRAGRCHPVQYLLGARKGAGKRVPRSRSHPAAEAGPARSSSSASAAASASQEGAAIVERAPYVDLVFGPQTLHRLPQMIGARRRSGQPQVDISFPEIEKFDNLPPARVEGCTAFVSIMEGCSKYCSFCVVPYTRGEEVSRPFDDVLTEVAGLADQGVKEITLLGQNVNAYRGTHERRRNCRLRAAARVSRRSSGHRTPALYDLASEGFHPSA